MIISKDAIKNILNRILKLDKKVDSHTHTISNVTGLQDKLDEVFQSVSNGKTLLETAITDKGSSVSKAGDVATFEELKTGIAGISNGVCKLNIFTQTEEPSTKEGLWLKTSNTYNDVLNIGNQGYTRMTDIPYFYYNGSAVAINNDIYLVGCGYYSTHNYRYNTTTNNYTRMTYIPYDFEYGSAVSVGSDIYLLGGRNKNNYKYNTLTDTYTKMSDIPYSFSDGSAVVIGNDIYLLGCGGDSKYNYKYDTTTDTYTKMADIPYEFNQGSAVAIGNNIYLLGGDVSKRYNYKYDTTTNTYTKLKDIPYEFYSGSAVSVGNDIYILGGGRYGATNFSWYNYKYDTTTNTYTRMTDIPYYYYDGSAVAIGNDIYLLGSVSSDYQQYNYKYNNTIYKNSILFLYDNIPFKYKAKIFNTSYERLNYINFNSVIMTDENGNNINVEVYIGSGNHWDKI